MDQWVARNTQLTDKGLANPHKTSMKDLGAKKPWPWGMKKAGPAFFQPQNSETCK